MTWILFDIGGVLEIVDDDSWQQHWWARWRERAGLERADFDARVAQADLPSIDVTTGTEQIFWQRLAAALGLSDADRAAMRADFWDAYCGTGNTELIDYARSLKSRVGLAILSNSADGAREEEARRYGFSKIFDPICYSHEQGVSRTAPAGCRSRRRAVHRRPPGIHRRGVRRRHPRHPALRQYRSR
jgi:FMN phosphatase YigB (HAD superfamily)